MKGNDIRRLSKGQVRYVYSRIGRHLLTSLVGDGVPVLLGVDLTSLLVGRSVEVADSWRKLNSVSFIGVKIRPRLASKGRGNDDVLDAW
jgi:hypothetical protein